jgi:thioesterase domain-containing protein
MKVADFLGRLRNHDIHVWVDGGRLRCSAPTGRLTPELRHELRQRKPDIVRFLQSAETLARQPRAVVPLQPRGTGTPVFAVAGHNGDVFCFRALARHLGADQPFFGLHPPGLDGDREPLQRVEDLAAYFASQIRALGPPRPCIIAGYCAGGTIALELAGQLLQERAPVRMLALFGSPFPAWYHPLPQLRHRLKCGVSRVVRHTRAVLSLSSAERREYVAERLHNRRSERATQHPANPDPVLVRRTKVERATLAALRRYTPRPFPGRLNLFWPSPHWQPGGNALQQWPRIADATEKYFGPDACDGSNMLRDPYASTFADLFRDCMARDARRESRSPQPSLENGGKAAGAPDQKWPGSAGPGGASTALLGGNTP